SGDRLPSGNVAYNYDSVGNRLAQTSTLPLVPSNNYGYDQNHHLLDDAYDANGNTRASYQPDPINGAIRPVNDDYDRSDRLAQRITTLNSQPATISLAYDGSGNRVRKAVGGLTTHYLVDDLSPSGWPQVVEELTETSGQAPA